MNDPGVGGCGRGYSLVNVPYFFGRLLLAVLSLGLALGSTAGAEDGPDPALPLLTRIKAIRALSLDDGARGYPVRIQGAVTHFDLNQRPGLILHDGESGQWLERPRAGDSLLVWNDLERGDRVQVEGYTVRGGFAPNVRPEKVRKLGPGALPRAKDASYSALLTGRYDCDFVEITGVVQRAFFSDPQLHQLFADVAIEGGVVRASFWDYEAADLTRFIDAKVRLRSNVGSLFGQTEQLRGVSLLAERTTDLVVVEPPPDPFSLPIRPIRGIYKYSATGEVNRRIRVRGVVIGQTLGSPVEVTDFPTTSTLRYVSHVLYVKDGTSGARIETEQETRVRPGDVVEVAGFPAVTPGKPLLKNAVFKVVSSESEPEPVPVSPQKALTPENDAELVRIQAQLLGVVSRPANRVLVLKVGPLVFDADLGLSPAGGALDEIRPGSVVSVTGVYSYQAGPPPSFHLLLRSPRDVVLLVAAAWWTFRHTAVTLAIVALVAGVAAFWVLTIGNRKRQQYQAILTERNRLARELHDTLEQGLAGITLQLEAVAGSLEASPTTARRSLDVARQMLRYSLEEARRSVMDLRSQALESRDLAGALEDLARQMTQDTPVRAEVRVLGAPGSLDGSQEHHLLRIGLEALTNALKHAGAKKVDIELRFGPEATELLVRDDGRGFGAGSEGPSGQFGLLGIRERVDKLGAVLRVDSLPGEGTRLLVTVPVRPHRAASAPPLVSVTWPKS